MVLPRLGLDDAVPEHSTFSKNRHGRFRDSDAPRHVFDTVLGRCMSEGLVAGEGFAIDASIIRADASAAHGVPGTERLPAHSPSLGGRFAREPIGEADRSGGGLAGGMGSQVSRTCVRQTSC